MGNFWTYVGNLVAAGMNIDQINIIPHLVGVGMGAVAVGVGGRRLPAAEVEPVIKDFKKSIPWSLGE